MSLFLLYLLFSSLQDVSSKYSCKGLHGDDVDWYVVYKLPKDSRSNGKQFYYFDEQSIEWTLSNKLIDDNSVAVGATIQQIYNVKQSFVFVYNDDSSLTNRSETYRGHAKGVVLFDETTGFWLTHSVPNFPLLSHYGYPASGVKYGQSFLCITMNSIDITTVGEHMKFIQATPYFFILPHTFAEKFPILRTITQKKSLPRSSTIFTRVKQTTTLHGLKIHTFAKHKKFNHDFKKQENKEMNVNNSADLHNSLKDVIDLDLWFDLIASTMGTSMEVESWLNGNAIDLHSQCTIRGSVYNIKEIALGSFNFPSTKDHSKWGVSTNEEVPIVCIGDTNRQSSQLKRGGGAVCLENYKLWRAYKDIIAKVEQC